MKTKRLILSIGGFLVTNVLVLLYLLYGSKAVAQDLQGDWEGVLKTQGIELPTVIHIKKESNGYSGTLDSPTQGGFDIPMSKLEIDGSKLFFEIKSIGAFYEGTFNQESGEIEGKYVQRGVLELNFSRPQKNDVAYSQSSKPEDIIGSWQGPIQIPGNPLTFVIHIKQGDDGLIAEADSPDQGSFGMPIETVKFKNGEFNIAVPKLGMKYTGRLLQDQQSINGFFEQNGGRFKLDLNKATEDEIETQSKRPQMPEAPFNYSIEDVVVQNKKAGIELAGTLTIPKNPKAAAIMITGSGPQDRDETIFGHKPFWVIADHLGEKGYAVLRMDDRGVGQSKGDFSQATSADFATDISAAVDYLKSRDDIPADKIGLIGHSEGGMIAPMVAAERSDVAFAILLAGPGVPITELLTEQYYLLMLSEGGDEKELQEKRVRDLRLNQQIVGILDAPDFEAKATEYMHAYFTGNDMPEEQIQPNIEALLKQYETPWFGYFLAFEPAQYLSQLKAPLLAINGSLDLQVGADTNLNGIRQVMQSIQHPDYTIKKLDKMNHLFQVTETGKVSEYGKLEETFSPVALNIISDWLDQRF